MSESTKTTDAKTNDAANKDSHIADVVGSSSERSKIVYPIGGFAPGQYWNKCALCGETFIGDKKAWNCEPCAINGMVKAFTETRKKLTALETALKIMLDKQHEIENMINPE